MIKVLIRNKMVKYAQLVSPFMELFPLIKTKRNRLKARKKCVKMKKQRAHRAAKAKLQESRYRKLWIGVSMEV